jgi:3-hydroxyacyl-[acyl-carrier-protein] dehydratase
LRETLKRCSPATYYAACKFRKAGRREDLQTVIRGVIERFVERDLRPKIHAPDGALRLSEDLGIDSLTMMEIVMIAEEVLGISVANDELASLRTLGDVEDFLEAKLAKPRLTTPPGGPVHDDNGWDLAALGEQVRRIDAAPPASMDRVAD